MSDIFVQLDVDYADDPKLADLSGLARLLYIDALCYAKKNWTRNGVLARTRLESLAATETRAKARALIRELETSGAIQPTDDGFLITGWLKRNKSADEIADISEKRRLAGRRGGHAKNHVRHGITDPDCEFCTAEAADVEADPSSKLPEVSQASCQANLWQGSGNGLPIEQRTENREQRNPPVVPPLPPDATAEPASRKQRGSPPPDHFEITDRVLAWASERAPLVDLDREVERALDWARANGRRQVDWSAFVRNWLAKAQTDAEERRQRANGNGRHRDGEDEFERGLREVREAAWQG